MKKSKFSEHQIVNILKEYEPGKATKDICGNMVFQHLPFINGNKNTKVWMPSI